MRVAGERFVLGREDGCDLVVRDAKVSRRHAELEHAADRTYVLRDLGSANGTYVNGRRVEEAKLRGAEQIQLGDTVLASSLSDPAAGGADGTLLGSAVLARGVARSQSAIQRLALERSLRRVTVLAGAAAAIAASAAVLLVTGVLPPGAAGESGGVQRVVRTAAPATLPITALRDGVRVGTGTGWVLAGAEGLVVTSAHVVNGAGAVQVGVGGTARAGTIVAAAPCDDLALVRVRAAVGLPALPLGRQGSLSQGETVVAVGYPSNASREDSLTSTTGVVSVVRSAFREPALDVPRYANVVQTDAAINPGNSGGPLLDLAGRVAGVTAAVRTLGSDGRPVQGQGYAIGADRVRAVLADLRRGRSRGWTGAGFGYRTAAALERDGLPRGLVLTPPVPGTAADAAGLRRRGELLVAVNGMPVGNSLAGYCDAVAGLRSGERVRFSVYDSARGRTREVALRLE